MRGLGLIPLSLLLFVTGCRTDVVYKERPVPVEVVKYRSPPVDGSLLEKCPPVSMAAVETNGDLLDVAIEANKRLEQCSSDKAELRRLLKENGAAEATPPPEPGDRVDPPG